MKRKAMISVENRNVWKTQIAGSLWTLLRKFLSYTETLAIS